MFPEYLSGWSYAFALFRASSPFREKFESSSPNLDGTFENTLKAGQLGQLGFAGKARAFFYGNWKTITKQVEKKEGHLFLGSH